MGFGRLTKKQEDIVRDYVRGQTVHDLGAGDLMLSRTLLTLGATRVVAIDKSLPRSHNRRIECVEEYFHSYVEGIQTAFVSWPCNWQDLGLLRLVMRCQVVLYLGTNTQGTMCGGREFFEYLTGREILAYEPDPKNTLIVYGDKLVERPLRGEEKAALNVSRIWSFEEAESG